MKFPGLEALKTQLAQDKQQAGQLLQSIVHPQI